MDVGRHGVFAYGAGGREELVLAVEHQPSCLGAAARAAPGDLGSMAAGLQVAPDGIALDGEGHVWTATS